MQETLAQIESLNASLVALSPQVPEFNAKVVDNNDLGFDILSDPGNAFAHELGLRFAVPENIRGIYQGFGINLPENNGDDSWTLPMPGRVVVASDGIVKAIDVDPDYTARPEPADTVGQLRALQS